jgi:hypothetical protein
MIFFIGVYHELQDGRALAAPKFLDYVANAITRYRITVVAEEWGSEADSRRGPSLVGSVITSGVKLIQFDLDSKIRATLNIKTSKELFIKHGLRGPFVAPADTIDQQYKTKFDNYEKAIREEARKREPVWLERLKPRLHGRNVLIICGTDHVSKSNPDGNFGFDTLLAGEGFRVKILRCFSGLNRPTGR